MAHLLVGRGSGGVTVDLARQNLAAIFLNEFVNAGFGQFTLKHPVVVVLPQVGSIKIGNMERPVLHQVCAKDALETVVLASVAPPN
ncbi:hypothetical protein OROMI_001324 [Orobanche minor]